jgi:hypothetical protein
MGSILDAANVALADGPSSSPDQPIKSDLRALFALIDALIASGSAGLGLGWKTSVRVATTTNGTISTAFENGDTVDGVVLATGNRILLKDQSAPAVNGIYIVQASGSPVRATDADTVAELIGAKVYVTEGTANAGTAWTNNNTEADLVTLGTDAVTFVQIPGLTAVSVVSTLISDSSSAGRALLTAADAPTCRSVRGVQATLRLVLSQRSRVPVRPRLLRPAQSRTTPSAPPSASLARQ